MPLKQLAFMLIGCGALMLLGGVALLGIDKLGIPLGRLPGDIHAEGKNWSFSFPIVTCLILSALLTLALNLLTKR